ncbi:alpha/beta fold hydrolase [Asanoa siamensis]|uniref:Non-heme chloroperoxidase n=1 Tax=Asanoa siamensis TaxID=926357 RepID=A0ABQ4CTC9_9ACTN|nr:alpha/beta hydrolase [Asanoa siamensis]GIF74555.1 non-heme chloroperoxidase [Asanoa siamensis]
MTTGHVSTKDNNEIFFKDWGNSNGQPVVFSHGWPLTADAWDDAMMHVAENGFRGIAHDRRGGGRSSQPWEGNDLDAYADDLAAVIDSLDPNDVVLVGHSTGGGEITRYVGRHGTSRVAKMMLVSAIPPVMIKSSKNPDGTPKEAFDQLRDGLSADRSQFYEDLADPFYGANRTGSHVSQGLKDQFWQQSMTCGLKGAYDCIQAFSETDLTMDLEVIDVPTMFIHGDDDQIVPIDDASRKAVEIVDNAELKVYPGAPHGLTSTLKDEFHTDLMNFLRS